MYNTYVYDSSAYGNFVSAHRVYFQMFKVMEVGAVNSIEYKRPDIQLDCSYGRSINESNNDEF